MRWNYVFIPKLQRYSHWSLGMDKLVHSTLYWACDYLSMMWFKLIYVSKVGPDYLSIIVTNCAHRTISRALMVRLSSSSNSTTNTLTQTTDKFEYRFFLSACTLLTHFYCHDKPAMWYLSDKQNRVRNQWLEELRQSDIMKSVPWHWQSGSIGSYTGLAPKRRRAIIWSSVGMFRCRMYTSFGLNEVRIAITNRYVFRACLERSIRCYQVTKLNIKCATDGTVYILYIHI